MEKEQKNWKRKFQKDSISFEDLKDILDIKCENLELNKKTIWIGSSKNVKAEAFEESEEAKAPTKQIQNQDEVKKQNADKILE